MQGRTARETELRLLRISCAAHIAVQGGSTHMTYFLIAIHLLLSSSHTSIEKKGSQCAAVTQVTGSGTRSMMQNS